MDNQKVNNQQKNQNQNQNQNPTNPTSLEGSKVEVFGIVVNCEKLNIRERATKDSKILMVVDAGTELKVVEEGNNGWTTVDLEDGRIGHVMSDYITIM